MSFHTADFCDQHDDRVQVLAPGYRNYGGAPSCHGEIATVKLDRHNGELITLLRDGDGRGKVAVVDVDQAYYAVVGENLMNFARHSHYSGIIVNGYIRDTAHIADIPVALFALGTCPRKYIPATEGHSGVALSFGGVDFRPGEYLYADSDGVIVCAERLV